jgi:hypothetical protein
MGQRMGHSELGGVTAEIDSDLGESRIAGSAANPGRLTRGAAVWGTALETAASGQWSTAHTIQ